MNNARVSELLRLLGEVTPVDIAMLDRQELVEFSDAMFDVIGATEEELEQRVQPHSPREFFEVN